jgi:hypothetical protein
LLCLTFFRSSKNGAYYEESSQTILFAVAGCCDKKEFTRLDALQPVAIGLFCICSGHAFDGEASSESTPLSSPAPIVVPTDPEAQLTPEQGRAYYDRFVTGDWGGFRTQLHNRGIDFNLDYFGEMAGDLHGGKDHFSGYPKGLGQS